MNAQASWPEYYLVAYQDIYSAANARDLERDLASARAAVDALRSELEAVRRENDALRRQLDPGGWARQQEMARADALQGDRDLAIDGGVRWPSAARWFRFHRSGWCAREHD